MIDNRLLGRRSGRLLRTAVLRRLRGQALSSPDEQRWQTILKTLHEPRVKRSRLVSFFSTFFFQDVSFPKILMRKELQPDRSNV